MAESSGTAGVMQLALEPGTAGTSRLKPDRAETAIVNGLVKMLRGR